MDEVTVRLIPPVEWNSLKGVFEKELKDFLPYPTEGYIAVVEHKGEVAGVGVLQQVWHVEPFWIREDLRGKGYLQKMLRLLYECLPRRARGVLCYTETSRVAQLLRRIGLEEMPSWRVFRWKR